MKTFKQFICEQKQNEAPRGVIFDDNKAIVGKEHEKPLILSDDLVEKIKKIGDNYGYWYDHYLTIKKIIKDHLTKILKIV